MVVHKVLIALAACSCFTHSPSGNTGPFLSQNDEQKQSIELTSPAFQQGKMIPSAFTCDGKNISPVLKWGNVPEKQRPWPLLLMITMHQEALLFTGLYSTSLLMVMGYQKTFLTDQN